MEEYTQITLDEWARWKEDIRKKLHETAENFVYIGCRLREIEKSKAYLTDGAADIFEFANKEYGLHRTTTQRFMAINAKFSVGGNSTELLPEYAGFGVSKLQEMLNLSDEDCALLTDKATVTDIRELKKFNGQQVPEDGGEAAGEDAAQGGETAERTYTPFQKCIIELFRQQDKREILNAVMKMQLEQECSDAALKQQVELINPTEYGTVTKGIIYLFMYDADRGIAYKTITTRETKTLTWQQFLQEIEEIYRDSYGPDTWVNFYGPVVETVEPVKTEKKQSEAPKNTESEACATSHKNTDQETEKPEEKEAAEETTEAVAETMEAVADADGAEPEEAAPAAGTDTEVTENSEETVEGDPEPEQPEGSIVEDPYYKLQEEAEELATKIAHTMKMYRHLVIDRSEMDKVKENAYRLIAVVEQIEDKGEERGADEHYRTAE